METPPNVDAVGAAIVEVQGVSDMFTRMQRACFAKCIPGAKESNLNFGEVSCVDRCVNKYVDVHTLVGSKLQESMEVQQKQQEAVQQTAQKIDSFFGSSKT
uniref:Mitochondrial import inner membrane translocase subunit n=1 Tax=Chromera velia CCMP2878 TaxID=1169474 RepID=A0A0G4FYK8_9ALVE|eukprot:Cvel_3898.t1-p1 / transcript=Cvel_3898.t1 / gene=Cvel_3898 / organism=Chromera_velia_CCMP2878 / gene_product=Mitochondrial import inner membrane translocase, putative / transcript_product=Mitochondrial import inner membrane translocase, putative / location=Cvel_scaffold165:37210-39470(-) / protein_length=100 / sequence_SO=supercontig / SO=protein_coding / is_pseudo=false